MNVKQAKKNMREVWRRHHQENCTPHWCEVRIRGSAWQWHPSDRAWHKAGFCGCKIALGQGIPPRRIRKEAKLRLRGTYRRADQWALDLSRKRVVEAAASLAPHLNLTTAELLAQVGWK